MKKILFLLLISVQVINIQGQEQTVGLFLNDSLSFNGYTLFHPNRSKTTYLIDNCGSVVKTWTSDYFPAMSVYLQESGNLVRTGKQTNPNFTGAAGLGGIIEIADWNNDLLWSYEFPGTNIHPHHDIELLPNGNILVICWELFTETVAIENGRDPENVAPTFWSEKIIEIEPIGSNEANIVWEWRLWDHMVQDFDPTKNNYGVIANHPELFNINYSAAQGPNANKDWIHANSIDYSSDLDQIIISSRNLSEVFIIDHSTTTAEAASHTGGIYGKGGDILYRYGNPEAYDRGSADDRTLFFQHDAQWIPLSYPDGGKIIVYNNQSGGTYSSVDVFDPPTTSPGFYTDPGSSPYGPPTFDWSYSDPEMYSGGVSGAHRLPNGNTLICEGAPGTFHEVTLNKELVWSYINPDGLNGPVSQGENPMQNMVFKIERYSPEFKGFEGKELVTGYPVELNPYPSVCELFDPLFAHLDLKVFLEGPFNNGTMKNELVTNGILPEMQPYNTEPWDFPGIESYNSVPGSDAVDWVMIELRDAENPETATQETFHSRQALLLLNNGSIVQHDGVSKPRFYNTITNHLFVVVHHRNHLGIMSSIPIVETNDVFSYDFTSGPSQVLGGMDGQNQIGLGMYGMISGNGVANSTIDIEDKSETLNPFMGTKGYLPGDFNLDGQVNNKDKNDNLLMNLYKTSYIP